MQIYASIILALQTKEAEISYVTAEVSGQRIVFQRPPPPPQWSEREETAQRAYVCNGNTFSSFLVT